jgi:hypothetical protein
MTKDLSNFDYRTASYDTTMCPNFTGLMLLEGRRVKGKT